MSFLAALTLHGRAVRQVQLAHDVESGTAKIRRRGRLSADHQSLFAWNIEVE